MGKHLDRAEILLEQHRYDLAEAAIRQEIAENPDSMRGHSTLALCLINQGKFAIETFELINYVLSLDAEDDWHHYLLALYWCHHCKFDRARSAIEAAIELDPNSAHYFYLLAFILMEEGGSKFQNKYLSFFDLSFINESYFIRSDLKPVFLPIERSLALNPEYLPTLNLLTRLLITTGRNRQALENSLSALSLDPNDEDAHDLHGHILTKLSKYSAAVESFKSALSIDPTLESARLGLLEAMRSQYWIYRWISITNWRGRLLLFCLFPLLPITLKIVTKHLARSAAGKISIHTAVFEILFILLFLLIPILIVWSFIAIPVGIILAVLVDRNLWLGLLLVAIPIAIVVFGYPAQWIFNLFLQLDRFVSIDVYANRSD
jgi:Flp pilus assembly protein TadD